MKYSEAITEAEQKKIVERSLAYLDQLLRKRGRLVRGVNLGDFIPADFGPPGSVTLTLVLNSEGLEILTQIAGVPEISRKPVSSERLQELIVRHDLDDDILCDLARRIATS